MSVRGRTGGGGVGVVHSAAQDQVAVSLSNHVIKLYRPRESGLEYERDLQGHSNTIGDLQYALPDAPHALHSCAADGTVLGWDTRVGKQVRRPASLLSPS